MRDVWRGPAPVLWALTIAGFVLIGLAWRGAAATLSVPDQLPYLVSGGFAGLALVVTGAGLFAGGSTAATRPPKSAPTPTKCSPPSAPRPARPMPRFGWTHDSFQLR